MSDEKQAVSKRSIRDRVRGSNDKKRVIETIDEWDGVEVELRSLSAREREDLIDQFTNDEGRIPNMAAFDMAVVIGGTYDPATGELCFGMDDVGWLYEKNAGIVARLAALVYKASGMDADAMRRSGKASLVSADAGSGSTSG